MYQNVFRKKTKAMHRPKTSQTSKTVSHIFLSAIIFCIAICIILAGTAAFVSQAKIPVYWLTPISTTGSCLAVWIAAFVLSLLEQRRGLLYGAAFGMGCQLIFFAIGCSQDQPVIGEGMIYRLLAMTASGAFGGYIATLLQEKQRRIR